MAEDVEWHGHLAQFHSTSRCEACQAGNHKCALQENDDSCMACAGASRKCLFSRTITLSGPKSIFPWSSLLGQDQDMSQNVNMNPHYFIEDGTISIDVPSRTTTGLSDTPIAKATSTINKPSDIDSATSPIPRDAEQDSPPVAPAEDSVHQYGNESSRESSSNSGQDVSHQIDNDTFQITLSKTRSRSSSRRSQSRAGLDPLARDLMKDQLLPSLDDQARQASLDAANTEVKKWLLASDSSLGDVNPLFDHHGQMDVSGAKGLGTDLSQHRKRSAITQSRTPKNGISPGVELDEEEESEGEGTSHSESMPASMNESVDGNDEPLLEQNLVNSQDAFPWMDPIYIPSRPGAVAQPKTPNAAIMRFEKFSADMEVLSRVATWGTNNRRTSESDMERILGPEGFLSRLSISKSKDPSDRWASFLQQVQQAANKVLRKRSTSHTRRKDSAIGAQAAVIPSFPASVERIPNISKNSKSLKITFPRPLAPMTPQIAALGGNNAINSVAAKTPVGSRNVFRRTAQNPFHRKSNNDDLGLAALEDRRTDSARPILASPSMEDDFDPKEIAEDTIFMDIRSHKGLPVPTFEGFKSNMREINPRLQLFLIDRLAKEQLRRFNRLVNLKAKHAEAKQLRNCISGSYCSALRGVSKHLPIEDTPKTDEDEEDDGEGNITAAEFLPGVPMPPVKRLPARFECPLCFQVKTFQKASDWSKHVHEDLQPFTCTFQTCPDPKSFKRKADWVRHENERHRKLEWWACTVRDCQHVCYRRDNFVQHLVREHKMSEPRAKPGNSEKPVARGPEKAKGRNLKTPVKRLVPEDDVIAMVETCRRETAKLATEEPCRFCGNVCNSWKKLTVHLAKHMEQVSVPVLELIKQKNPEFEMAKQKNGSVTLIKEKDIEPSKMEFPIEKKGTELSTTISSVKQKKVEQSPRHSPIAPRLPSLRPNVAQGESRKSNQTFRMDPPNGKGADIPGTRPWESTYSAPLPLVLDPGSRPVPSADRESKSSRSRTSSYITVPSPQKTQSVSGSASGPTGDDMKTLHSKFPVANDARQFVCPGKDCDIMDKVWPGLDSFKEHLLHMHPDEDVDELIKMSRLFSTTAAAITESGQNKVASETPIARASETMPVS